MAAIKLGGENVTLNISPWFDSGYIFKSLEMREEIGDKIASGIVRLTSNGKNLSLINTENSLHISYTQLPWKESDKNEEASEGVVNYEIDGYIYHKEFLENEVHLSFVAINNKEFTTVPKVAKYKDITIRDIIKSLYPGRCEFWTTDDINQLLPDMNDPVDSLDQNGMTDFDFCSRLCRSYKRDAVYSFGLEGLFIKHIYRGRQWRMIYGESDNINLGMYDINYYKEMDLEPEVRNKSVNLQSSMYGFKYDMVRTDFHSELLSIYQHNERYTTNLKCRLKLRFLNRLPKFKIGDLVKYKNKLKFNEGKMYVVTYMNFSIDRNTTELQCEISSWDDVTI